MLASTIALFTLAAAITGCGCDGVLCDACPPQGIYVRVVEAGTETRSWCAPRANDQRQAISTPGEAPHRGAASDMGTMRLVTCGALGILITACAVDEPPAPARVAPDEAVLESKGRASAEWDLLDATDVCVLSCTAVMALSCGAVVAACYGVSAITVGATVIPCGFACGGACGAASLGVAGCVHLCT